MAPQRQAELEAQVSVLCRLPLSDTKNYEVLDAFFDSLPYDERIYALTYGSKVSKKMIDDVFAPYLH